MKGRTTQLLLFLVGSGIELLVDVSPNDKVSLVKLNVATQLANRLGFWFRLPWAWPMLCHPVYGLDVAKRLVQLVENGRLGNGSFEYYKIDCAGVLSTPALWAAVVAFARGTAPLADAACNQSLKIYAERVSFAGPLPRPSRPRRGHHTRHTTHTTNERLVGARPLASRET